MGTLQRVSETDVRPGDWIEADSPGGGPGRRGQILEVVGTLGHHHYRVRWDESHESMFYPAAGARLLREPA